MTWCVGLAAELLCDAKDYSVHAKKAVSIHNNKPGLSMNHHQLSNSIIPFSCTQEIDVDDVRLASMLSDTRVNGVEQSSAQLEEVKKSINQQNLVEFVDPEAVLVRYPPSMFTKQAITYVSSEEAYGEVRLRDFILSPTFALF